MTFRSLILATAASAALLPAAAQAGDEADGAEAFGLGQIIVTAPKTKGIEIGSQVLTAEAILTFDRVTLDDAANLIPGVSAGNSGGSRNERLIFVRGFDRFQVPI